MLLGVDVGGTFTDAVLLGADGALHTAKVPSTPGEQSVGVLEAVRTVLARAGASAREVERFAHGMTVATNALLEGRTARTALLATAGFTDVLELARQNRPHLYRLCESPPAPLVPAALRFAVPERMGPEGPLRELEPAAARELVEQLARAAPEAVAVSLLHSYADPAHERLLGEIVAERLPDTHLSLSSELVGTFREYERTATTVLDAALSPLLAGYLGLLADEARALGLREPQVMQSSGGLTDAARAGAHAALTVLSGPAGGVGGALALAELAGEPDVLCFDMGGTSCDVCVIERLQVPETPERTVAGRPLSLPALDIHTVGAGGGSIAWRDAGGALRVGPASAGADPGPACYGRGGREPTVTDANLLLGRLLEDSPLAGGLPLDVHAAERAVSAPGRETGPGDAGVRGGDRARRRGGDAGRAARDERRARHRPARLRADALRRRRPAARGGARARAGHLARALPARVRRAVRARPRRRRAPPRRRAHGDARRARAVRRAPLARAADPGRGGGAALAAHRRGPRPAPRWRPHACACATSCATAASRSSCQSTRSSGRGAHRPAGPRPRASCARRSRARTSCATATATSTAAVELVNMRASVWGSAPSTAPAGERRPGRGRGGGASGRSSTGSRWPRACSAASPRPAYARGRARRCARCQSPRCWCRPAGRGGRRSRHASDLEDHGA